MLLHLMNRLMLETVLIKEEFTKRYNYPLGSSLSGVKNDLDETTGAIVLKGNTREKVKRHSRTLIPLLTINDTTCDNDKIIRDNDKLNFVLFA